MVTLNLTVNWQFCQQISGHNLALLWAKVGLELVFQDDLDISGRGCTVVFVFILFF